MIMMLFVSCKNIFMAIFNFYLKKIEQKHEFNHKLHKSQIEMLGTNSNE